MVNKRAQFFILSAVIIAAIIVGFVGIKNYAQTGQAPQKFYFYSEQLEKETGAVVDYALYKGDTSGIVEQFLQRGIQIAQQNNPGLEVYACYTNSTNSSQLICINRGSSQVKIKTGTMNGFSTINGTTTEVTTPSCSGPCQTTLNLANNEKNITMQLANGINYTIPINSPLIQSNQFYFIFQINTSAGTYVDVSGDSLKGSSSVANLAPPVSLSNS